MITRGQVQDLKPGDVVELTLAPFPSVVTRGPLRDDLGFLRCGTLPVRLPSGAAGPEVGTLTVVSRAPRPLYVNHPRTEPVDGDIVRDCDGDAWLYRDGEWFVGSAEDDGPCGPEYFKPLQLLWDGETEQVVQ